MKLRTRLLIRGAAIPTACLLGTIVLGGVLFEQSLMRSLDDSLRAIAAVESVSLFDQPRGPHVHASDPPLFEESEANATSRAVYAVSGERVVALEQTVEVPAKLPLSTAATSPILRTRTDESGEEIRELIVPVEAPNGKRYVLWLAHPTKTVRTTVGAYARTVGGVGLLAMVFLLVLQTRFANRLAARIRNLSGHMERLIDGDLGSRPADDPIADELGALRTSIAAATEKLEHVRHTQERLLADAAHELRTPLAALRANIDITLRRERNVAEFRSACGEMREEVDRLSTLATTLLALARGRHTEWMMGSRDLRPLLDETIQAQRGEADERHVEVALDAPPHAEAVCDADAIRQAFENLLANAIKFSPESARVDVSATDAGDSWRVAFSNDGPAIPSEEREAIFEPFRRLDTDRPGTGLGLTIVRDIVQRHGGQVFVAPTNVGNRFVMTVPKPTRAA